MNSILVERLLLPAIGALTTSKFPRLADGMRRFDRLAPEEARRWQWESLLRTLDHAREHVPLYRDRFSAAGLGPGAAIGPEDLPRIPPLTRQDVAAHFPDGITEDSEDRAGWRFAATSGTTSQRMIVLQDFAKREAIRAAAVRSFTFTGLHLGSPCVEIPPDVCNVQCGLNREAEPPLLRYLRRVGRRAWTDDEVRSTIRGMVERQVLFGRTTLPSFDARGTSQPEAVLDGYVDQLRALRPSMLKALPMYLLALARHIRRRGIAPPTVGEIRPMGSALAPSARSAIGEAFGCRVVEDYGSAELGPIGCECAPGSGIHLFSDLFHVEIVRGGVPVPPARLGGS